MRKTLSFQKPYKITDFKLKQKPTKVGVHGILGCFTDEAWNRFVREELKLNSKDFEIKELVHSSRVLKAVEDGKIDIGIFAFANSGSGGYSASVKAMGKYSYKLLTLFTMPINMCMLVHPDIKNISQIKLFYGHPVAVSQCKKTLAKKWPNIPIELATDKMDTALSAQYLALGKIPKIHAIFASKRAAEIYKLKVLYESVHHDPNNATAFAVVRKN